MPRPALSGTRIRALRTARRMGQADLARLAGVSPSYLNLIEHNRRRAPPRLLIAIAQALEIPPSALDEDAGEALADSLRAAVAAAPPEVAPETDRIDDLVSRFPGWAGLLATLHTRAEGHERVIERLSDRMAHDPNLSAALHEIVSAVTAVQSTAAILADSDDLEPEWRTRFHANIHADSLRLADAAEALVAFLDNAREDGAQASPTEELESWLARQSWHIPALEEPGVDAAALVFGQAELASAAARSLARAWLQRAQADAQALPLARIVPTVQAMLAQRDGVQPEALAQGFGVPLVAVFRRLAALPPGVLRAGLMVCDATGTPTYRRPLDGFQMPRFGGGCALWPLYQALAQPGRPLRTLVAFAGLPPARFVAHAVAGSRDPWRYDPPHVWESAMLIVPAPAATEGAVPLPVGSQCRVCARLECAARREPSIVAGASGL